MVPLRADPHRAHDVADVGEREEHVTGVPASPVTLDRLQLGQLSRKHVRGQMVAMIQVDDRIVPSETITAAANIVGGRTRPSP